MSKLLREAMLLPAASCRSIANLGQSLWHKEGQKCFGQFVFQFSSWTCRALVDAGENDGKEQGMQKQQQKTTQASTPTTTAAIPKRSQACEAKTQHTWCGLRAHDWLGKPSASCFLLLQTKQGRRPWRRRRCNGARTQPCLASHCLSQSPREQMTALSVRTLRIAVMEAATGTG